VSRARLAALVCGLAALLAGCGEKDEPALDGGAATPSEERQLAQRLSGTIRADGPQVLQSFLSAAATNFEVETPVEVRVEESGTETAFDKLCTGRIVLAGARREMTRAESRSCERREIGLERLKIANHAVAVAAGSGLGIDCLTTDQLERLWRPGSAATRYSELGDGLPARRVLLYGPPVDTDSFALFTALVNGRAGAIRADWRPVPNRNAMTARLRGSDRALGFFNLAQLIPTPEIRFVAVDAGEGCVEPTEQTVQSGRYPLVEDLYLYVSRPALERLRLRSFMRYVIQSYAQLAAVAPSVVPATSEEVEAAERRLPEAPAPAG